MTGDPVVTQLDPADADAVRAFWDTEQAAQRADRTHPLTRSWTAFAAMVAEPSPFATRQLLVVRDGEQVVAGADLVLTTQENLHLAEAEINVLPRVRRRGLGRALHDEVVRRSLAASRTTVGSEVLAPIGADSAAMAFARAMGYLSKHAEHHLAMTLPGAGDRDRAADPAYEILTWTGRCPDLWRAAYVAMRNQMSADVPVGEVDWEPVVIDEHRLGVEEARSARAYDVLVAAARHRGSGVLAGYSKVYLAHGEPLALQDDTLVMPDHRGHRLGAALKRANHAVIAAEHPERSEVHTWTDPDNIAMYRTNTDFGFVPVEQMHEMELRIGE